MYNTDIPDIIIRITESFYWLRVWSRNERTACFGTAIKVFHFAFFLSFLTSVIGGAFLSSDTHEFIFLADLTILLVVHAVRMFYIIWKKNDILTLIHQIGSHYANEFGELVSFTKKLKMFDKFAKTFVLICIIEVLFALIFPVVSSQKILLNIAFPWKTGATTFWITHSFIAIGCAYSILWFLLSVIIWYLMINLSSKYQLLGNQLRNMGVIKTKQIIDGSTQSETLQEELFLKTLVEAVRTHQKINRCSSAISYFC